MVRISRRRQGDPRQRRREVERAAVRQSGR
jgi:hypothetical protein